MLVLTPGPHGGALLHAAMQASLTEVLQDDVRIFRDTDPETGISPGRSLVRRIVEALSGSLLFFWVQSPRWLRRQRCCSQARRAQRPRPTGSGSRTTRGFAGGPRRSRARSLRVSTRSTRSA